MSVMDLSLLVTTLKGIVDTISGIPAQLTRPDDSAWVFPQIGSGQITDATGATVATGSNVQANCTIDIMSVDGLGYDEWRASYDPNARPAGDTYSGPGAPLGGVVYTLTGQRQVTVQFKFECFDPTGAGAHVFAERTRTRMGLPSVELTLNAAGYAYQDIGPSHTTDYDDGDGRRVGVTIFEMILNAADFATDDAVTTIETVALGGITST